jgi:hypothetical protein
MPGSMLNLTSVGIIFAKIFNFFFNRVCRFIDVILESVISLQRNYSKSSDEAGIQYSQLSHYNVATVKVVMIPAYNILITT